MRITRMSWLAAVALLGCGGVGGTYTPPGGEGFFQQLHFDDGKVEITFIGMTKEGTYVEEDDKVKVTVGNETMVFKIDDDGCLDGGGMLRRYCKGEKAQKSASSDVPKELSGTWQASDMDGAMALEFRRGGRVRVRPGGANSGSGTIDGEYEVDGDRVIVRVAGEPLTLERRSSALVGTIDGETIRFTRR